MRERRIIIKETEDDDDDKVYTVIKIYKKIGFLFNELYFNKFEPYLERLLTTLIKVYDIL